MDQELVSRAQRGDESAFAEIAYGIGDRLFTIAHRILRDVDLAEDATQQAVVAIWRELPGLRDPARFEAWSYRVLVNACYAQARAERRWSPSLHLLETDHGAGTPALRRRPRPAGARVPSSATGAARGPRPPALPRPDPAADRRDRSASRSEPCDRGFTTRAGRCVPPSRRTRGRR